MTTLNLTAKQTYHLHILKVQVWYELIKSGRPPIGLIMGIGFPLLFYIVFALFFQGMFAEDALSNVTHLFITYSAFGVMGTALFNFGVGISSERNQGWLRLQLATPMPPMLYFVSKLVVHLIFSVVTLCAIYLTGNLLGDMQISVGKFLLIAIVGAVGALPFCSLGLWIGYRFEPKTAVAIINIIYLPMAFLSGLFIPLETLPKIFNSLAVALPAYHYAQLMFYVANPTDLVHLLFGVIYLSLMLMITLWFSIKAYSNSKN